MSPRSEQRQHILTGALLVLTFSLLLGAVTAPSARALPRDGSGDSARILCANPTTGEGLGLSGMPEGLSNPADTDLWQVTAAEVECGTVASWRGFSELAPPVFRFPECSGSEILRQSESSACGDLDTTPAASVGVARTNRETPAIARNGESSR